jgi:PTH1 family peptidyl-tRNA hydrolase
MKIIIGLGNPGEKYNNTRHNAGFEFVEKLREAWNFPAFEMNNKFDVEISRKEDIILAKPQTFMNLSGEAVQKMLAFYKLTADDIIVIHDDLDIEVGKFKVATDSSSAGHNGVQDIIDKLGTQKFLRIRIGIGQKKDGQSCITDTHNYVLQKFTEEEKEKIEGLFGEIKKEIEK